MILAIYLKILAGKKMEKKKTQCFLITSIPDLRISVCSPAKDAGGILPAGWPYINILDGKPDIGGI